ncbi:unnamed protein product [Alternaria sp. RS040]
MDSNFLGRPPTRRRAFGDGTNRANEGPRPQRGNEKRSDSYASSSPPPLPHNESIVPNGTLSVRHEDVSPENKRLSAVQAHEGRPHNPKRDSEISNASTNASNSNRRRKTHIGPWQLGRTIGRGGCSRVRLVRHSGTGQFGAAKIISKATAEKVRALSLANLIQSAEKESSLYPDGKVIPFGLEREICIMKLLDHPNIVRLYDIWENRDELYLIMEFVEGGELFSYIHEQHGLIEIHTVHIFRQIIAALIYCHRINIHHRDLKPENILLDRDTMTVKLVDFGMAALQPIGKKLTTPCGSPHYAAPEVIKTTSYDGGKADVWSCGVILFVLLTGTPPFNYSGDDRDLKHLFRDIAAAKYIMPDNISREAQDLIGRILIADPTRRISIDEIWNHPFLRKYSQELNFMGENANVNHWTGPLPAIAEWINLEHKTVDREILRYLRTLWHSEKEEVLIQKLLSQEPSCKTSTIRSAPKPRTLLSSETPRLKLRKPESPTKYIEGEARKFSQDLDKFMDVVFNSSSVGSSVRSDAYHDASQYDSPPTSFSNTRDSGGSTFGATPGIKGLLGDRPLPPIPAETPNTLLERKLAATREEIAKLLNEDENSTARINNVLENLDRLMLPAVGGKRIVSAPVKSPEPRSLRVIPEEAKSDNGDGFELHVLKQRAVADPVRPQGRRVVTELPQTIRIVDGSPIRIAPLNVRKRSGASLKTNATQEAPAIPILQPYHHVQNDLQTLPTENVPPTLEKQNTVLKKKKSLWFRRNTGEQEREQEKKENQVKKKQSNSLLQIPEAWQGLDDRKERNDRMAFANIDNTKDEHKPSDGSIGSEFPMRISSAATAKSEFVRKGFFAFFGKKLKDDKGKRRMELGALNFSSSSILSNFDIGSDNNNDNARAGPPEIQMNWLSRFLHIRPASKTLCFHVGRGKVRQDLVRLLRDWQRFGVQDVSLDREVNSISARIDKSNHLKIKPVTFVIELFVVLEHGRRANLCLARFTQTRGAASSFRKVVDIVEDVCRARCMLVEDEEKKASMMAVLE